MSVDPGRARGAGERVAPALRHRRRDRGAGPGRQPTRRPRAARRGQRHPARPRADDPPRGGPAGEPRDAGPRRGGPAAARGGGAPRRAGPVARARARDATPPVATDGRRRPGPARAAAGARLRGRERHVARPPEPGRDPLPQAATTAAPSASCARWSPTSPTNVAALLWLAKAVRAQDRPQAALDLYERALALEAAGDVLVEAVDARHPHGRARRRAPDPGRLPRDAADARPTRRSRARSWRRRKASPAKAERELRAALALDPARVEALQRLVDLLDAAGRAQRGRAAAPAGGGTGAGLGRGAGAPRQRAARERRRGRGRGAPRAGPAARARRRVGAPRARARAALPGQARGRARARSARRRRRASAACCSASPRRARGAWEEAARHYREALAAGPPDKDTAERARLGAPPQRTLARGRRAARPLARPRRGPAGDPPPARGARPGPAGR